MGQPWVCSSVRSHVSCYTHVHADVSWAKRTHAIVKYRFRTSFPPCLPPLSSSRDKCPRLISCTVHSSTAAIGVWGQERSKPLPL